MRTRCGPAEFSDCRLCRQVTLKDLGGLLGLLGGHAQRYQLAFDGKQPLTCGNVFGVIGSDWNLPDSSRTVEAVLVGCSKTEIQLERAKAVGGDRQSSERVFGTESS